MLVDLQFSFRRVFIQMIFPFIDALSVTDSLAD